MAKKRSFFERLAGNLRFDDEDENDTPAPVKHEPKKITEKERELHVNAPRHEKEEHYPVVPAHQQDEEVGELPVDVYETAGEIVIQTLIAGVLPEHLSINITRDVVIIAGRREENKTIADENYHLRELYWGSFGRTINLPVEVEIDAAEAIERHGMLMVKLPKLDKQRKTALKIKSI